MKKTCIALVVLLTFLFTSQKTNAASIPIFWSTGEVLSTVEKLPSDYTDEDGNHLNLAILHKRFSLFWIPMWNYGEFEYVMTQDNEKTYYPLNMGELELLESEYDIKVSAMPSLSIWQKIGGKPLLLLLIAYIVWSYIPKKKNEDELATEAVSSPEDNLTIENNNSVENTQTTDTVEKEK